MSISSLIQKWSGINEDSRVIIITDDVQKGIAEAVRNEKIYNVRIEYFTETDEFFELVESLEGSDLIIVMLSIETYMKSGVNKYFTAFGKPDRVRAKYIFMRLDISMKSLVSGLATDKELVYCKIKEMNRLDTEKQVIVTSECGTDISFMIRPFTTCSHEITADGGMAFLPPSETSAEVVPDTANGKIIVDMTVGQLYHYGELKGYFGLVSEPVTVTVKDGYIVDIVGDEIAENFKERLFALPMECRKMVELGQGLSKMSPTGLIGVDESIIDSCHFGFGDGGSCGTHLDVVIREPVISQG